MYCEASGWIMYKVSEPSFQVLIWGETDVTVLDLYTYRGKNDLNLAEVFF